MVTIQKQYENGLRSKLSGREPFVAKGRHRADLLPEGEEPKAIYSIDADMRELADTVPHKMWFSGACGGVLFLNARFFEYTGLTAEQTYGNGWKVVVYPDDLKLCTNTRARDEAVRNHQPWRFEYRLRRYDGEFLWHVACTVPLFDDAGRVRRWVGTATEIHDEKEAAEKQRRFLREVLASVTEDRLRLCDSQTELPTPLANMLGGAPIPLSRESLGAFRGLVAAACEAVCLPPDRTADLVLAAGEAAMNAVVHGGGGEGRVYASKDDSGSVQVWVADRGDGIAEDSLHRATLERGYTTAGTLGHGFPLMLRTVDRVYLLTGAEGTLVVVEKDGVTAAMSSIWT